MALGVKRSAAERHPSLSEQCQTARSEVDALTARLAELEQAAHTARVAAEFETADQAHDQAEALRPELARAQSRLAGLEAAEREVSAQRQRDAWEARLAELQAFIGEQLAEAQRHVAEFRPALSAAKMSARLAAQCEQAAREAAWEAEGIKVSLGRQEFPDSRLSGLPRPATAASERDRYWLTIATDGEL